MVSPLQDLAINVCVRFPEESFVKGENGFERVEIDDGVFIPAYLCDRLLEGITATRPLHYLKVFCDPDRCRLTRLNLSNRKIAPHQDIVNALLDHSLEEINFSNAFLDRSNAEKLGNAGDKLMSLNLSGTKGPWCSDASKLFPKLHRLTNLDVSFVSRPFGKCIESISLLKSLVSLSMSSTVVESILPLLNLSNTLKHLYLFDACKNIKCMQELEDVLPNLKSLTHLDISKEFDPEGIIYATDPYITADLLGKIATLPNLLHLDISACKGLKGNDLDALRAGLERKLDFLGLFGTNLDYHDNLPAKRVSGVASELQILTAIQFYKSRETYIEKSLRALFHMSRDGNISSPLKALQLIISASKSHLEGRQIQLATSACIFSILQLQEAATFPKTVRRSIIYLLLDIMDTHRDNSVLRNCLQCFCSLNIPSEVEFVAITLCKQFLRILKSNTDQNLCRVAALLFNAVLSLTSPIKLQLGQLGAVKILLDLIKDKCRRRAVDNLFETCWCALWNITDETPENCEDFINNNGLDVFKTCIQEFEGETELQKSILGLMGNVAEVKRLRRNLLDAEIIELLVSLLDTENFDFEVNYNSAGVLAHVCSDGDEAWMLKAFSRQDCMAIVTESISKWDVGSSRNINYRSLKPILQLLPLNFNPCGQEWAVWALANLTKVYPDRYCKLLESEGGVELLTDLLAANTATQTMKRYAEMTLSKI